MRISSIIYIYKVGKACFIFKEVLDPFNIYVNVSCEKMNVMENMFILGFFRELNFNIFYDIQCQNRGCETSVCLNSVANKMLLSNICIYVCYKKGFSYIICLHRLFLIYNLIILNVIKLDISSTNVTH